MTVDNDGNILAILGDDLPPDYVGGLILVKLSPTLELISKKAYGGPAWLYNNNVRALDDGGCLVSSEAEHPTTYVYYSLLMKFENC